MHRKLLAVLICVVGLAGLLQLGSANAASSQVTVFDATLQQTHDSYWEPPFNGPNDWTSPTNYAGGTAYWRVQFIDKPSSLSVDAQVCVWRHGATKWQYESCSNPIPGITKDGTYFANLKAPNSWWKKNGNFDWSVPFSVIRIMVKDHATGKLLLDQRCGDFCYTRDDLDKHVPIKMDSELVFVAKGAALTPLANWQGCPSTWSPQCPNPSGGGGSSSSSSSSSSSTTTTAPTARTVSIADASITEPDSGYVSLPFKITLSKKSSSPVSVTVKVTPGTATAGDDYGTRGGTVTVSIPAGSMSKSVGFPVYGDTQKEGNETFNVTISSVSGATVADGEAVGTVINDD